MILPFQNLKEVELPSRMILSHYLWWRQTTSFSTMPPRSEQRSKASVARSSGKISAGLAERWRGIMIKGVGLLVTSDKKLGKFIKKKKRNNLPFLSSLLFHDGMGRLKTGSVRGERAIENRIIR